ncbi:hypothetical protein ACIQB5_48070 [Streptomyces sp. NPDC088560]|uniref:hypothetical protein n=1 Tax=Streptomyces sp. NPDC088560 TaxID=3365868 RepID=UPI0037FCA371
MVDEMVNAVPVPLDTLCPRLALRAWLDRLLMPGRSTPELADAKQGGLHRADERVPPYRPMAEVVTALVGADEAAPAIVPE